MIYRLLPAFIFLCAIAPAQADDWPQFRGINASGIAAGTDPIPTEFSFEDKVLWKEELGDGNGSAVIASACDIVNELAWNRWYCRRNRCKSAR